MKSNAKELSILPEAEQAVLNKGMGDGNRQTASMNINLFC